MNMNMNENIFFNNLKNQFLFENNILKKHVFFYIAQKIIDKESKQLTINLKKVIITSFINTNQYSIKNKFKLIKNTEQNILYNEKIVNNLIDFLCKIQQVYFALIKFKNICIYKKAQTQVDYDICLNPINTAKKTCICIYQNKKLYWFLIRDLINIINTALINAPGFFSEPLVSKNPYNNMPFNKSTLYNIYFSIKYSSIKTPELIHKFFITNFDLDVFTNKYEYLIRENVIDKYIKTTPEINLYQSIIIMLDEYNKRVNPIYIINVHYNFPKEKLVKIFKPYLLLYFVYSYSLIKIVKVDAANNLNKKLKQFSIFNPNFGQKILNLNRTAYFDDSHISFNIENNDTFLTSHNNNTDDDNIHMFLEDENDDDDDDDDSVS